MWEEEGKRDMRREGEGEVREGNGRREVRNSV